jgi:hypothetical protein
MAGASRWYSLRRCNRLLLQAQGSEKMIKYFGYMQYYQ